MGAAIDYGRAASVRTQLLAAADAASLASVRKGSAAMTAAASMNGDGPIADGATEATKLFNAEIIGAKGYTLNGVAATTSRKPVRTFAIDVNFSAPSAGELHGPVRVFLGYDYGGSLAAANNMPLFIDFYLLLDNTPSMGVGATTLRHQHHGGQHAGQVRLRVPRPVRPEQLLQLAKKLGVKMRIDVLRTATQQLMDTAAATQPSIGQFRMAIYTFGTCGHETGPDHDPVAHLEPVDRQDRGQWRST